MDNRTRDGSFLYLKAKLHELFSSASALLLTAVLSAVGSVKHLAMMPELREVTLQSTQVTGEGLRHLAACKSLRTINCWGIDVTSEDIRRLKEILPKCEIDKNLIE